MKYKSGFVTIIGRPNVGKSTLLNRIAGEKIAIMSDRPQTTRNSIKAVVTDEESQIIFIDTPGIHRPKNKLGEYMVSVVDNMLKDVDIILYLVEATDSQPGPGDRNIIEKLSKISTPVFLIINKMDLIRKEQLLSIITNYKDLMNFENIIPISAARNEGMDIVLDEIRKRLPEGPKYYSEDMLTDQLEKNIAAEMIREKILQLIEDEVPHGVGVEVISYKQRQNSDILDINANIYCEKETHKGILIGKGGAMLKQIGSLARGELENLTGNRIYLQIWVKVKPDWRNDEAVLKNLGYR